MDDEVHGAAADAENAIDGALLSRLELIEEQPLERRAAAFVQVHDELRSALESADAHDR